MPRPDRLVQLIAILRNGQVQTAGDLAARLGVSQRTIYRDIARLGAAGIPVQGTRGTGYRVTDHVALPPLTLAPAELDALNLGIAIVSEAADPELSNAARTLADKIEAALPAETIAEAEAWKTALTPLADPARGLSHMAGLRDAIAGKQKLHLTYCHPDGRRIPHVVRPLRLAPWGGVWILTVWCDSHDIFHEFRTDLIETATPLPELFVDEPGKRLSDHSP